MLVGRVSSIKSFGAFVHIGQPREGLVHISKISYDRVDDIRDYVSVGDEREVRVLERQAQRGDIAVDEGCIAGADTPETRLCSLIGSIVSRSFQQNAGSSNLQTRVAQLGVPAVRKSGRRRTLLLDAAVRHRNLHSHSSVPPSPTRNDQIRSHSSRLSDSGWRPLKAPPCMADDQPSRTAHRWAISTKACRRPVFPFGVAVEHQRHHAAANGVRQLTDFLDLLAGHRVGAQAHGRNTQHVQGNHIVRPLDNHDAQARELFS